MNKRKKKNWKELVKASRGEPIKSHEGQIKVPIAKIKPNPFRNIDNYPILEDKVKTLMDSMKSGGGFWDNLIARENDGYCEIAYGHHRLEALKRLKIKEVNLIIKNLSNRDMIQIMANENIDTWKSDMRVIRETVLTTKKQAEIELKDKASGFYKYKTQKAEKGGYGDKITADDISWYLGKVWQRSYQKTLINDVLKEQEDIKDGLYAKEDADKITSPAKVRELRRRIKIVWSAPKVEKVKNEKTGEIEEKFIDEYMKPKNEKEKEQRKKIITKVIDKIAKDKIKRDDIKHELIKEKVKVEVKKKDKTPDIKLFCADLASTKISDLNKKLQKVLDTLIEYPDQIQEFHGLLTLHFWDELKDLNNVTSKILEINEKYITNNKQLDEGECHEIIEHDNNGSEPARNNI